MGFAKHLAAGFAAAALFASSPAAAQSDLDSAEKIRRLDIMLMVTALRCRFGADNFQADYEAFSARHLSALNAAGRRLTQELSARHGAQGAKRALDRLMTGMANSYGMGHPTMDCGQLKQAAHGLAYETASDNLVAAADVLLADQPGEGVFLLAQR
jgi:hypothetical protein